MKIKYIDKELIRKIGIYFRPLLTLPFSTIETIREEKNEITAKAPIEKYLKLSGFTLLLTFIDRVATLDVAIDSLDINPMITIKRLYDKENSKGAIKITMLPIKIM